MGVGLDTRLLLEREAEVARITELVAAVSAGHGALMYIEGQAGIGKTRLVEAAAEEARDVGLELLSARGSELEQEFAYGVVRQLFEPPVTAADARRRRGLLAGAAGHAATALAIEPAARDSIEPPATDLSFTSLHGLYWLCANLCELHPALLVVDDAHWADAPSLRFLEYLGRRVEELPIGLIVAARPREPASDSTLLARLATDPRSELLQPKPLTRAAVERIVSEGLGDGAPEFIDVCQTLTGGSPFLLRALIRSCAEDGLSPQAASVPQLAELVPSSVSRAILLRLGRLPPPAAQLARAVAVLEPMAELRHAARLARLDEAEAAETADLLASVDLLRPGRPLAFSHPLVRAAVYANTPTGARDAAHAEAAELLRADHAPPERLAVHLLAVDRRADAQVVQALREAARRAAARGGPDVAAKYLRRALAEPPPAELRAELLLETGMAEALAGDPRALLHLEDALEATREESARVVAAATLGRTLLISDRPAEAVAIFERALEHLTGSDDDTRLLFGGAVVGAAMLDADIAPPLATRLEELMAEADVRRSVPFNVLAVAAMHTAITNGSSERAARLAERALAREGPLAEGAALVPFFHHACAALLFAERYDAVRAHYDAGLSDARERGSSQQFAATSCFLSWLELHSGDVAAAEAHARAALDAETLHEQPLFRPMILGRLLAALVERGQLDVAELELERASPQERSSLHYTLFLHERGALRIAQGRPRDGLDDLRECGRRLNMIGAVSPSVAPWRSTAALAHLMLGEREDAGRMAAEELELARAFGAPRALGAALRTAGLVEAGEAGVELLREAVATVDGTPAKLEHSRALTDLGAALRRANRRAEAREYLRLGLDGALRGGAIALAERARAELLATGARPRRLVLSGVEALTPSERRIASMAADGMTNREIAQALFVSARTVEGHLTHAYQKLEIDSRDELAAALAD